MTEEMPGFKESPKVGHPMDSDAIKPDACRSEIPDAEDTIAAETSAAKTKNMQIEIGKNPALETSAMATEATEAETEQDIQKPEDSEETENWWDDPGIPWNHKPTKSDLWCFGMITFVGIFSLVMMPLRPIMLANIPQILSMIGSMTGTVMSGALIVTGDQLWPLVWFMASLGNIKFDWVYWWAGWLWGHNLIEIWSGKSERAKKRNARAVNITNKFAPLAIALTYTPVPVPGPVVYAAIGAARTPLWKFMLINWVCSFLAAGCYLYLGYSLGAPAVDLIQAYGKWMTYLSIAILIGMVIYFVVKGQKEAKN